MATSEDSKDPAKVLEHDLTEEEIDERATSDTPLFSIHIKSNEDKNTRSLLSYFSTVTYQLLYPPEQVKGNQSVVLRIVKLSKGCGGGQAGYVISSPILQDNYLQVTEQGLGSGEFVVKFTSPRQTEPLILHQSQLFQRHKDPNSETKFAFYITVEDREDQNKVYYLKPESGTIVAKEDSAPDGYHYFSLTEAKLTTTPGNFDYDGTALSDLEVLQDTTSVRPFVVGTSVNSSSMSLYESYGGNYSLKYRSENTGDNSFIMWLQSLPGGKSVWWSNSVIPSYLLTVIERGSRYNCFFIQGSGSQFTVVSSPESPDLLAFTTTYTSDSKKVDLYLDIYPTTMNIIATVYTSEKLPDSAYMFSAYKVTSPAVPSKGIIPRTLKGGEMAEPKCEN